MEFPFLQIVSLKTAWHNLKSERRRATAPASVFLDASVQLSSFQLWAAELTHLYFEPENREN